MPRNRNNGTRRRQRDAIALLKEDHQKVKRLLEQLESATGRGNRRASLLAKIEKEIKIHSQLEEEIFYPAYRDAVRTKDDKQLYFEALEEHHVVDMVVPELKESDPSSESFAAKAKLLKELVLHHVKEEEKEMFPRARRTLGAERLTELGEEMQRRKEGLEEASVAGVEPYAMGL